MSNSSQRAAPASAPTRTTGAPDAKRRRFLLALGAGGAGAAAVATNALAAPVLPETSAAKGDTPQGYRVTDHVRDYYASTRI